MGSLPHDMSPPSVALYLRRPEVTQCFICSGSYILAVGAHISSIDGTVRDGRVVGTMVDESVIVHV